VGKTGDHAKIQGRIGVDPTVTDAVSAGAIGALDISLSVLDHKEIVPTVRLDAKGRINVERESLIDLALQLDHDLPGVGLPESKEKIDHQSESNDRKEHEHQDALALF
jgi:hypothetical protein